ncbi:MAG: hypothetical protein EXR91_02640 [Gemmatimonadetes bacterium]|nr:hypothetical protein [Gemmatimonadota bacterium]
MRRGALVLCLAAASAACADEAPPPPSEFRTTAAIEEVMRYIVDPAADAVWDAVVIEVGPLGTIERVPTSDEDWATLRRHAMTLVEATNLLLMEGRRVAVPGSRSEMPGVDLEPEEIEALLSADRPAWNQFVGALHESGLVVLDAIDRRDVDALLVAGDQLDLTCENCHLRYWYPGLASPDSATN